MTLLVSILAPFAVLFFCMLARVLYNRAEIRRLERNGYRKLSARFKASNRGFVDSEAMRGFAELGIILLLLFAVMGWLGFGAPL